MGTHFKYFRINHFLYIISFVFISLFIINQPSFSAVITVTNTNDDIAPADGCSLREAIINAENNNQDGSTECTAGDDGESGDFDFDGDNDNYDQINLPANTINFNSGDDNESDNTTNDDDNVPDEEDFDINTNILIMGATDGTPSDSVISNSVKPPEIGPPLKLEFADIDPHPKAVPG